MSRKSQHSAASRESILASIVDGVIDNSGKELNIIDFLEAPWGPKVTLYPVQKMLARLLYGVPFDYKPVKVPLWDKLREELIRTFDNESDFLKWLFDNGKANISDWRDMPPGGFHEMEVFAGRRGGKPLSVDELIPTPNGFVRNGSITEGMLVYSPEGKPIKVLKAHEPFESPIWKVYFSDGSCVETTADHVWRTHTLTERFSGGQNRTTREIYSTLYDSGYYNHAIPAASPIEGFATVDEDPYLIGAAFAAAPSALTYEIIKYTLDARVAFVQGLLDQLGAYDENYLCEGVGAFYVRNCSSSSAKALSAILSSLGTVVFSSQQVDGRTTLFWQDCTFEFFRNSPYKDTAKAASKRSLLEISGPAWRHIVRVEATCKKGMVRCITVDHPQGLYLFGTSFITTHNSEWLASCASYSLYRMLRHTSPQEYYSLSAGSPIDVVFMAQDEEGASRLYDKTKNFVNRSAFFTPFLYKNPGTTETLFVSEDDRGRRDILPSISMLSLTCTTRSARGPSAIFLALDEFAHFRSASGSNSEEVYTSATPSTLLFENPEGYLDSKIVIITSPLLALGKSYDLHKHGMKYGAESGLFTAKLASAEMNPRVNSHKLKTEYMKDPQKFEVEYGGEFLSSAEQFVPKHKFDACIDQDRLNVAKFMPENIGRIYFHALDLAFVNDGCAMGVCHWEADEDGEPLLVYDYIDQLKAGEGEFVGFKMLPLTAVWDWIIKINNIYPGYRGVTDQHAGAMFIQQAEERGISFYDLLHINASVNSKMYYTLRGLILRNAARFPKNEEFEHQINHLEVKYTNKYQISVAAPNEKDEHDDLADVTALCAVEADEWLRTEGSRYFVDENFIPPVNTSITGLATNDCQMSGVDPDALSISTLRQSLLYRHNTPLSGERIQGISGYARRR